MQNCGKVRVMSDASVFQVTQVTQTQSMDEYQVCYGAKRPRSRVSKIHIDQSALV